MIDHIGKDLKVYPHNKDVKPPSEYGKGEEGFEGNQDSKEEFKKKAKMKWDDKDLEDYEKPKETELDDWDKHM